MSYLTAMNISVSGLYAQRIRMNTIAQNIANINSTRTHEGGPYRRQDVVFSAVPLTGSVMPGTNQGMGVMVTEIIKDSRLHPSKYDPGHPDADAGGYVTMPNVDMMEEMVNLITAARSYEANIASFQTARLMTAKALDIGV